MMPRQILGAILLAMVISATGTWQVLDSRMSQKLAEHEGLHSDVPAAISNADASSLHCLSPAGCQFSSRIQPVAEMSLPLVAPVAWFMQPI
ncbi:hypothetical protein [Pseudomonas sp. B329]|uniref:hypothetical protein n=1 Tax=Pseudomonas sp. B329 TaxID=1553459 RepID=UPI0032B738F6